MFRRVAKCTKFWLEGLKGRDQSEDLGIDERIILNELWEIGLEGVDWIHLAKDREQLRAAVNTVRNS
jgi:hypothetical protein